MALVAAIGQGLRGNWQVWAESWSLSERVTFVAFHVRSSEHVPSLVSTFQVASGSTHSQLLSFSQCRPIRI